MRLSVVQVDFYCRQHHINLRSDNLNYNSPVIATAVQESTYAIHTSNTKRRRWSPNSRAGRARNVNFFSEGDNHWAETAIFLHRM